MIPIRKRSVRGTTKIAKFSKHKPLRKSIRALSPACATGYGAGVFPSLLDESPSVPYSEED